MYATFNMGTGFCVVVAPGDVAAALAALRGAGEEPVVAGSVTDRPGKYVSVPAAGLVGRGEQFFPRGDDPPGDPPAYRGAARPPVPPRDTV
jgi:hypothetical protein